MPAVQTEPNHDASVPQVYLLARFRVDASIIIPFQDSIFEVKRRLQQDRECPVNPDSLLRSTSYLLAGCSDGPPDTVEIKHLWGPGSEPELGRVRRELEREIERLNERYDRLEAPIEADLADYHRFVEPDEAEDGDAAPSGSPVDSNSSMLYLAADDGKIYALDLRACCGEGDCEPHQPAPHISDTANHLADLGIRVASIPGGSIPTRGTLCYLVNIRNIEGIEF